jgi:uncharacterized protein (DUF58 family)
MPSSHSGDPRTYRHLPPALAEAVHTLGLRVRRPVRGRGEGIHRSPDFGASVEFADYRPYVPGDPPNRIDWSVYARTDRYLIRRFQEETSLRATLLLDCSESLAFRELGALSKFDYACQLVAALSYALVRQGDAVAVAAFSAGRLEGFPPVASISGLRTLLEALEDLRPAGHGGIGAALEQTATRIGSRSLVIVVSDFLEPPESILRGLKRLDHDRHNLLLLHVVDGAERRIGFHGLTELRELETGRRLVVEAEETAEAYAAAFDAHIDRLRRGCAECFGEYRLLDTREPVKTALQRLNGSR